MWGSLNGALRPPRHMSQQRGSEQHDTGNTAGVRIKAEASLLWLQIFVQSLTRAVQRPSEWQVLKVKMGTWNWRLNDLRLVSQKEI